MENRVSSPVRALTRGLEVLRALNLSNGSAAGELARVTGLPRPTVYRILDTLQAAGYVARDTADERYRVTTRVRGLSDGFDEEAWVVEAAIPRMRELSPPVCRFSSESPHRRSSGRRPCRRRRGIGYGQKTSRFHRLI